MISKFTKRIETKADNCIKALDSLYNEHIEWLRESVKRTITEFDHEFHLGLHYPPVTKRKYNPSDEKENIPIRTENTYPCINSATKHDSKSRPRKARKRIKDNKPFENTNSIV